MLHDVDDDMTTFHAWWKTVDDDEVLEVQYPHERHGLACRRSNQAKTEAKEDFLEFVDANIQPHGPQAGSYSAQYFFVPKFTRIAAPRPGDKSYKKVLSSVVSQFNGVQAERGKPTCGNTASTGFRKLTVVQPFFEQQSCYQ